MLEQGGREMRGRGEKKRERERDKKIETRVCVYGIITQPIIVTTQIINELLARGEGENMLWLWEKKKEGKISLLVERNIKHAEQINLTSKKDIFFFVRKFVNIFVSLSLCSK